jgi:hypothetical protein
MWKKISVGNFLGDWTEHQDGEMKNDVFVATLLARTS